MWENADLNAVVWVISLTPGDLLLTHTVRQLEMWSPVEWFKYFR